MTVGTVKIVNLHQRAKFQAIGQTAGDMAISPFFKMSAAAIFEF